MESAPRLRGQTWANAQCFDHFLMASLRSSLAVPNCVNGMLEESNTMDSAQDILMRQDCGLNVVSTDEGTGHDRGAACMLSSAAVYEELIHNADRSGQTAHAGQKIAFLFGGQNCTLLNYEGLSRTLESTHTHTMQNRTAYKLDQTLLNCF